MITSLDPLAGQHETQPTDISCLFILPHFVSLRAISNTSNYPLNCPLLTYSTKVISTYESSERDVYVSYSVSTAYLLNPFRIIFAALNKVLAPVSLVSRLQFNAVEGVYKNDNFPASSWHLISKFASHFPRLSALCSS